MLDQYFQEYFYYLIIIGREPYLKLENDFYNNLILHYVQQFSLYIKQIDGIQ